jgi:hypothetical protein
LELKRLVKDEEGNVYATWVLTPDQFGFLLHYAITDLIEQGVARVNDISEEELAKLKQEAEDDQTLQILENLSVHDLQKA